MYDNARADVEELLGRPDGSLHAGPDVWAIYVDAYPACGQCGGCGGSRVAVVARGDLRGLVGERIESICPGDYDTATACRFIGGLGHEIGHAFGLQHPVNDYNALMSGGFRSYPQTYLRSDERQLLLATPYFAPAPTLGAAAVCGPVAPGIPGNFRAEVDGGAVRFRWSVPPTAGAARAYTLQAGSAPGLSNLASIRISVPAAEFQAAGPPGSYFVRLIASNDFGTSAPTADLNVVLGTSTRPPAAPTTLSAAVVGRVATLDWEPGAGVADGYLLEAGTVPGAANLAMLPVSGATRFVSPALGPGIYYVRVRALSAGGTSAPSPEAVIEILPPTAPRNLVATPGFRSVRLTWLGPLGGGAVTGYQLEAGTSPGASNLASIALGAGLTLGPVSVQPGTYYVRVRAVGEAGVGPPSNEVVFTIS